VTSNGTQFDRLGIFTFQNVESKLGFPFSRELLKLIRIWLVVWRTSTPEPTRGDGIIWEYIKDVTRYTPLFAKPGTFILQLDNLIQQGLDGVYSSACFIWSQEYASQSRTAVLSATYYASSDSHPPAKTSDLIVPLSTLLNNTGNDASVPPGFSVSASRESNNLYVGLTRFLDWRDAPPKYGWGICRAVCIWKWKRRVLGRPRRYISEDDVDSDIDTSTLVCLINSLEIFQKARLWARDPSARFVCW